MEGKILTSQIE